MNGTEILVTVLIPTRNRSHLLKRTLISVTQQAVAGMEVCIIDNNPDAAASDAVKQMVYEFEQTHPNISWRHFHSNKPFAAGARNDGIEIARGKYICLLDDDDELLDESIAIRLNHIMAGPDIALLYCAANATIHPYPLTMYRYYRYNKKKHQEGLMMMSCSCIIINKKIFETNNLWFDERLRRMEDYDLCRRVTELGLRVKSIPRALVRVNLHPNTRMSSNNLNDHDFRHILISKWGNSIEEYMNNYGEGIFIWRKCFGIQNQSFKKVCRLLTGYMNREPSISFKAKYLLLSISPLLFLGMYHLLVTISQFYKNSLPLRKVALPTSEVILN